MLRGALLLALTAATAAQAQIVVLHSEGQTIEPLGVVPVANREIVRKLTNLGAVQVGYAYDFVALYGIRLWAGEGRYCLYVDRDYWVISRDDAATLLGLPKSEVSAPLVYWFPPGQMVGVGVLLLYGLYVRYGKRLVEALEKRSSSA
jgi:hypothetical protein